MRTLGRSVIGETATSGGAKGRAREGGRAQGEGSGRAAIRTTQARSEGQQQQLSERDDERPTMRDRQLTRLMEAKSRSWRLAREQERRGRSGRRSEGRAAASLRGGGPGGRGEHLAAAMAASRDRGPPPRRRPPKGKTRARLALGLTADHHLPRRSRRRPPPPSAPLPYPRRGLARWSAERYGVLPEAMFFVVRARPSSCRPRPSFRVAGG